MRRYTFAFGVLFDFSELVALLDLSLELGNSITLFGLLFDPNKFFALLIEDLISKPLKALIFSFPNEQLMPF